MTSDADPPERARTGSLRAALEGQGLHLLLSSLLVAAAATIARATGVVDGTTSEPSVAVWFWLAIASALAHQTYVMLCWRAELHFGLVTRLFGGAGFPSFVCGFAVLVTARLVFLVILAGASAGTAPIDRSWLRGLALMLAVPAVYTLYSVVRYFGIARATGADHFEPGYRGVPLVRQGAFRLTPNAMYAFGLLVVWMPGLWYGSWAAILAGAFHHAYIWVHYRCTEKPDMRRIYG